MISRALLSTFEDTVHDQFQATARRYPDHPFLLIPRSACRHYADDAISYTYRAAAARIGQLREQYAAAGLGLGHRVALMFENRPQYFFHWFALNAVGASVVPLNPDYRHAELCHVLMHSEACLAVGLTERLAEMRQAIDLKGLAVVVQDEEGVLAGLPFFTTAATPPGSHSGPQRECALLYTSGTTGSPKGCLLSNEYFLRSGLRYMNRRGYVELEMGCSRILTPLPMFHINAMAGSTMGAIFCGGCLIQLDRFHPSSWWQDAVESGATGAHCLGIMPALLLKLPPSRYEHVHQLRYCTAANVEPQHHAAFEERFGVPLIEGWSMTETGAGAAISADTEPRHIGERCFGRPSDSIQLRLVDDNGHDVPPNQAGEMLVRSTSDDPRQGFFSGYLKDAAATEAGWAQAWWHTGDIVRRGDDGSLYFVDRKNNLIRRSGENISALEVEVLLRGHPAIHEVAVTSVADEVRGEEVFTFVRLAEGHTSSLPLARELAIWVGNRLAYYKIPGYWAFVPTLPVTATQKIERGRLRRLAGEMAGSTASHDLRNLKTELRKNRL
ncbi:MAG: AMP-binding protein [Pigmentiphaga sp.]